jgi:hypothetical protein
MFILLSILLPSAMWTFIPILPTRQAWDARLFKQGCVNVRDVFNVLAHEKKTIMRHSAFSSKRTTVRVSNIAQDEKEKIKNLYTCMPSESEGELYVVVDDPEYFVKACYGGYLDKITRVHVSGLGYFIQ